MKPSHIEHLGIAVTSIEEAMPFFEFLTGEKCYSIEEVADQKVRTAFFKVGQTKIELLEPTCPESTIAKFIEKNGGRGGVGSLTALFTLRLITIFPAESNTYTGIVVFPSIIELAKSMSVFSSAKII